MGFYHATDMALRGNLVYSTWLTGGLHVIDISDPSNPVEVAEFRSPAGACPFEAPHAALSDVALYGDYVLTTTVWEARMHILQLR